MKKQQDNEQDTTNQIDDAGSKNTGTDINKPSKIGLYILGAAIVITILIIILC
jgi:hypothetical protein